jgi:uncharacterized protein YggE
VQVVAPDPGAALREVDEHVRRLQALLDDAGIPAAARRTTYLAVNPVHGPQGEELAKQSAFYGLDVTVADLAAAGRLVQDAAEALGTALRVHRFALQVRDVDPHLERARRDAVQSAADKALQLAQASGLRLGPLLTLVESGASGGGGMWMTEQSGRVAGMAVEPGRAGGVDVGDGDLPAARSLGVLAERAVPADGDAEQLPLLDEVGAVSDQLGDRRGVGAELLEEGGAGLLGLPDVDAGEEAALVHLPGLLDQARHAGEARDRGLADVGAQGVAGAGRRVHQRPADGEAVHHALLLLGRRRAVVRRPLWRTPRGTPPAARASG